MLRFGQTNDFLREIYKWNKVFLPHVPAFAVVVGKYDKFLVEPPKKTRLFLLVSSRSSQAKFSSMQKCWFYFTNIITKVHKIIRGELKRCSKDVKNARWDNCNTGLSEKWQNIFIFNSDLLRAPLIWVGNILNWEFRKKNVYGSMLIFWDNCARNRRVY